MGVEVLLITSTHVNKVGCLALFGVEAEHMRGQLMSEQGRGRVGQGIHLGRGAGRVGRGVRSRRGTAGPERGAGPGRGQRRGARMCSGDIQRAVRAVVNDEIPAAIIYHVKAKVYH